MVPVHLLLCHMCLTKGITHLELTKVQKSMNFCNFCKCRRVEKEIKIKPLSKIGVEAIAKMETKKMLEAVLNVVFYNV